MYSVKVTGTSGPGEPASSKQQALLAEDSGVGTSSGALSEDVQDLVPFSAGNPRVEHLTGTVRLYRHAPRPTPRAPPWNRGPNTDPDLPEGRGPRLCILALPQDMGFAELSTFMGPHFSKASEVRLVRREGGARAARLVLLRFAAQKDADAFFLQHNDRPFCTLEPELLCHAVFVRGVECEGLALPGWEESMSRQGPPKAATPGVATPGAAALPPAPPGVATAPAVELPSCPVCLERLDEESSGIVTTVCNHRFHNDCLRHWGDSSCPVCRYCQPSVADTPHCSTCACTTDLWICLICGHVGCGRYRGSHASDHWEESGHGYALELGTQRVWDYLGDAYVHRLIQSKAGGKPVEAGDPPVRRAHVPATHAQSAADGECCSGAAGRAGPGATPDGDVEDPLHQVLALSKFDALVGEYNHLLVTQLESQRMHFEGLLIRAGTEAEDKVSQAQAKAHAAGEEAREAKARAGAALQAQQAAERKLAASRQEAARLEKERKFLKEMCDALVDNQKQYTERLKTTEEAAAACQEARDTTIRDLQEQVRDLMVFIEARQSIGSGEGGLAGGSLLPLPEAPPAANKKQLRRASRR
ncbi:hypothetical protein ACKKBG_A27625 [Auxenochlorella protothecoides x Auxenochlorella symbiontica]